MHPDMRAGVRPGMLARVREGVRAGVRVVGGKAASVLFSFIHLNL